MKRIILFILLLLPLFLFANIITIPDVFTTIQDGIDVAASGDTVLVLPGTYYENIEFSNKSNVTLCSLEATTGDSSYIHTTIINGSNEQNPVILCLQNVYDSTFRGLSITGGTGCAFSSEGVYGWYVYGGGLYFAYGSDVFIINCEIYGNSASKGGGIFWGHEDVNCSMSNVNIYNNVAKFSGGGVCFESSGDEYSNVVFDQIDRCSIYNNYSPIGADIAWNYNDMNTIDIYLDLFTWYEPAKYYVDAFEAQYVYPNINPHPIFDIQRSCITPVENNLYVSMSGDDSNSGLTVDEPLRTAWKAFQQINPSDDNPLTVFLLDGDFTEIVNNECVPIVTKSNTTLQGVSTESTHIYASNLVNAPVSSSISLGTHHTNTTIRDLAITVDHGSAIGGYSPLNAVLDNILVIDSDIAHHNSALNFNGTNGTLSLTNSKIINNTSSIGTALICTISEILIENVDFIGNSTVWDGGFDIAFGVHRIYALNEVIIRNCRYINNSLYNDSYVGLIDIFALDNYPKVLFDNCLVANNTVSGVGYSFVCNSDYEEIVVTNSTFANNTGVSDYFLSFHDSANVSNCIVYNNIGHNYDIGMHGNSSINNCLFSNSTDIYNVYLDEPIEFGANNLVGTDPLFVGGDPAFLEYYYLSGDDTEMGPSPAIDAGTMDLSLFPANYEFPLYDLAGEDRIYGSSIDIGCYEFPGYTNAQDEVPSLEPYSLANYPNPFNPSTNISFTIPVKTKVELAVYNVKGQRIKTLYHDEMESGEHHVVWDGKDDDNRTVSSGIYFCKMRSKGKSITTKMVLMK